MIPQFKGYNEIVVNEGGQALEVGGYELKIISTKVETFSTCSILKVAFDIVNHPKYEGFYRNKFASAQATNPQAKWSGVFDVFLPKDDGTENDLKTKQNFKRFITSVEKSNSGYAWNWDETSLKDKFFGGIFGREQFITKDGKEAFAVKCRFPRSIETIRSGDFKIPDDKLLKQTATAITANSILSEYEEILTDDGAVPF